MKKIINVDIKNKYEELLEKGHSKTEIFQILFQMGHKVGDISFSTKNHYSFVYGVCDSKVGVERKKGEPKTSKFKELFDNGLTVGQIAKETNSNYSYVHTVIKKYKNSKIAN